MTIVVLTVVVIALFVAVLAIFLFVLGVLLNRIAGNLDDCAQNVNNISRQAKVIGPGVVRINKTGGELLGALPLLVDGAEGVAVAKSAPYVDPSETPYTPAPYTPAPYTPAPYTPAPAAAPRGLGYLDA